MRPRKRLDLRQARHRPVRIHQFAQHCKRRQTRQLHRIDTAPGMPAPGQHPVFPRHGGNTCPGRARSSGAAPSAIAARTVESLSAAETPVVTPRAASTDTVNAVPKRRVLRDTIGSKARRRAASASIHKQTIPLHKRIISASCPTVISDAANTGSLSFPRSASSTSDIPPPAASAETAAGIRRAETSPHIPSSSIEYARQTQGETVRKTSRKNGCRFAGNSTEFARSAKRQANIKPEKTARRQIVRNCNKPFSGTGKPLS